MAQQFRLEVNGRPVRNPFLRTVLGVIATVVIAAALLLLGVILLPIFIALLAVAGVAGYIYVRRFRRAIRDARTGRPPARDDALDPSMEVRVRRPGMTDPNLPPENTTP